MDGRSLLGLAQSPTTAPWSRTAILGERETDGVAPNRWDMLRMKDGGGAKVYTRHETGPGDGDKEYYDLRQDPNQLHNALGAADTTYEAPGETTLAHYEARLDDLVSCSGAACRAAEDAPLLPPQP